MIPREDCFNPVWITCVIIEPGCPVGWIVAAVYPWRMP